LLQQPVASRSCDLLFSCAEYRVWVWLSKRNSKSLGFLDPAGPELDNIIFAATAPTLSRHTTIDGQTPLFRARQSPLTLP
jgi:hypothetical protein